MSGRAVFRVMALALVLAGCGRAPEPGAGAASDTTAADSSAAQDTTAAGTTAQLTAVALSRPVDVGVGPYAFRHERHRTLACSRCHTSVAGHAAHSNIACSDCHAPVPAAGPAPTPADCATCHHANSQQRACVSCHAVPSAPAAKTLQVTWKLSVWPAPRTRDVRFDHAWHTSLQCTDCHVNQPQMVPTRECGACHEHHDGKPDCRSCHPSPPVGAHTVAAHNGCAGSGCHQNPPVTTATVSRNECLLCHADRVEHEPGKDCARCHLGKSLSIPPVAKPPGAP